MANKRKSMRKIKQVLRLAWEAGLGRRRLLDPDNPSVTLLTLERAAKALGKNIRIELAA